LRNIVLYAVGGTVSAECGRKNSVRDIAESDRKENKHTIIFRWASHFQTVKQILFGDGRSGEERKDGTTKKDENMKHPVQ
jgi:hypothetical protein